jgi:chemotaxis-related protein WspB
MLLLVFQLGSNRFALDAQSIVEVAPYVKLEAIAHAPDYVAGLFDFRGELVPVIDLRRMVQAQACKRHMTSRIMLVQYPLPWGGQRLLGLLAEQVTETIKLKQDTFSSAGIHIEDTPYLGDIARDELGMIHLLRPEQLLTRTVCEQLFAPEPA